MWARLTAVSVATGGGRVWCGLRDSVSVLRERSSDDAENGYAAMIGNTVRLASLGVALASVVVACAVPPNQLNGKAECSKLLDTWLHKAPSDVSRRLPSESLETQYSVYLCGTQYMHPPAKYLAEPLASQGEQMATFLRQKLIEHPDDVTTNGIVRVFDAMQWQGTYDVRGDTALMALLQEKVQAIRDPYWRGQTEVMLARIARAS